MAALPSAKCHAWNCSQEAAFQEELPGGVWELFLISPSLKASHPHLPAAHEGGPAHICCWPSHLQWITGLARCGFPWNVPSNCPPSEGSRPPPLCLPLLHLSELLGPSSFPTACAGTATAGTRASPVGGPHSPPAWLGKGGGCWGAGGLSPSPFFFPGARHWGAEVETLENSLEVKEFGSAVQAPLIPGPSWECH